MLADIAVGDSWNTKNGYPDFTEADGRNFCFIRSERGQQLLSQAVSGGYIEKRTLDVDKVKDIQAYQYGRRHIVGWRIMAAQITSNHMLKFNGLGLIILAFTVNLKRGFRELLGTYKRAMKNKKDMKDICENLHRGE